MKQVIIAAIAALFAFSAHAAADKQAAASSAPMTQEQCTKALEGKNADEQQKFKADHTECAKAQ